MNSRLNHPILDALTGHWLSMTGTALVTLAGFSWLFLLPLHMNGHASNPYIGLLAFIALPMMFFTGLALIPVGAILGRKAVARRIATANDPRGIWRRAAIFFGVMTAANIVIASQLSYRAVGHMETVQFCGQTCHVMKPEFTAHMQPPHAHLECVACHVAPGAAGFVKAKMAGTRQLLGVALNNFPRPIPSAMEDNRLVSSAETCEQCHEREKPMSPKLRILTKYKDDEANTPSRTVLMMMTDKIHGAHLAPGVEIRYAASDSKRQNIPWVEYRNAQGVKSTYIAGDVKAGAIAALPKFEMQCVDCHNRAAHTFETPDQAIDRGIASGAICADLPFVKRNGLALIQGRYATPEEATAGITAGLSGFYRQTYPDLYAKRGRDIQAAGQALAAAYNRNVFPDLRVTWGTYPNNLGHADYPGCFRCHDGSHTTPANESITQDCGVCHNAVAVEEAAPEILKTLGVAH